MKWKNKYHEFEETAQEIVFNFKNKKETFYIFGAGIIGKELLKVVGHFGCFDGFIDNSEEKIKSGYLNRKVIGFKEYLDHDLNGMIIVAASENNEKLIEKELVGSGKIHGKDFYFYSEFMNYYFPILCAYHYKKVFLHLAQISLTERCTLKCEKCAHACHLVDIRSNDMELEEVYDSLDTFFSKVDFIKEFVLIGGEPLLYAELDKAIKYVGERYREKIGVFSITTNATIVPNDQVLEQSRKYDVWFRISNYSVQIPKMAIAQEKLIQKLKERSVEYILEKPEHLWRDYGFDSVDHGNDEKKLMSVFDGCKTVCREIRKNKFYYCVSARAVSENANKNIGQTDYLDFNKLSPKSYLYEILEFNLGFSEKGYLDMCRYCHGSEAYKYPVPAAKQVERG